MKIALIGDLHFGCRNDSIEFHDYFQKFFTEIFFPYLADNGINTIIQVGDLYDRRKFINFNSLQKAKSYFFDKIVDNDLRFITLVGNHDSYFKNTLSVNSSELTLSEYGNNIEVVSKAARIDFDGVSCDIIPWVCPDNINEIKLFIEDSNSDICFGHFELSGFEVHKGITFRGNTLDTNILGKYKKVLSGHFHHKSDNGHIYYLGTPYQLTWGDYDDLRGFYVFDTETLELEFIENPNIMFQKIFYSDNISFSEYDFSTVKNKYVKIIIENRENKDEFNTFIENIEKNEPYDYKLIEDYTDIVLEDDIDQSEDTLNMLLRTIDDQDIKFKYEVKEIFSEIYKEAMSIRRS